MILSSPNFIHNDRIPPQFTCDAQDVPPILNIEDIPENTVSLALIMDDPDAPNKTFVHWVLWNIPKETVEIDPNQAVQGNSDFQRIGYGGPCPPSGTHRYFFKLYALDTKLDLPQGSTKQQLEAAMQGHIIEQCELIGLYSRST